MAPSLAVKLGRAIQQLRKAAGPSQEAFAYAIGVHRTHMSALERGVINPTLTTLELVAKGLRLPLWQLFRAAETDEMPDVGRIETKHPSGVGRRRRQSKLPRVAERRDTRGRSPDRS